MKTRQPTLLLHPLFLTSLALLLLNDFYLKYEFHNWFTGKLSDFAGLFVFAIFFIAIFPIHKKKIIISAALFFIWWKSSYSNSFIALLNETLPLQVERTVDYTDLIALLVLSFAFLLKNSCYKPSYLRSLAVYLVAGISFFSFCATSMVPHLYYTPYRENEVWFDEKFYSSFSKNEILEKLSGGKNNFKIDSVRYYSVLKGDSLYYRIKNRLETAGQWIPTANNDDSSLFVKKTGRTFYVIPEYVLDKDTLYNMEVEIYPSGKKKKPTKVEIKSFQTSYNKNRGFYYKSDSQKEYKKYFKALLGK